MPNDSIASKLQGAKSSLAHAEKSFPSSMAPPSSRPVSAKPAPAPKPVESPKPSPGSGMTWGTAGHQEGVDTILPKMHKGGIVKKTSAYKMQKGEGVIPAKAMKGMKAGIRALAAKGKKK